VKPSPEQIGSLLALKRYESPREGYWDNFICEFHQNQRQLVSNKTGIADKAFSITTWFSSLGPSKWVYGAGLAYATVIAALMINPKTASVEQMQSAPVNYEVAPVAAPPVQQLQQLDLSPATQGNIGEQMF
jgi:hypothetical protein